MPITLRVDAADYGALSRALKRSEPTIRKHMRREIGAAVRPVIRAARSNILAASGVPTPFRVAAARRIRLVQRDAPKRTEVAIVAPPALPEFPDAARSLNRTGSFRHPLFGNRDKWYAQSGPAQWFDGPFTQAQAHLRSAVEQAMNRAVAELESRAP